MKKLFMRMVRFYQTKISPRFLPGCCKFSPTCSHYSLEAIDRFGAFKGSWLSLKRIVRCNPFNRGDYYDPVPPVRKEDGEHDVEQN